MVCHHFTSPHVIVLEVLLSFAHTTEYIDLSSIMAKIGDTQEKRKVLRERRADGKRHPVDRWTGDIAFRQGRYYRSKVGHLRTCDAEIALHFCGKLGINVYMIPDISRTVPGRKKCVQRYVWPARNAVSTT